MLRRADFRGESSLTTAAEVKRILKITGANKNDVFYDLGCGHGKVCIRAAKVAKLAVGIEDHVDTYRQALKFVEKSIAAKRVKIRHQDIFKTKISDATIVYTVLDEDKRDLDFYEKHLKKGCRFVTTYVPLIGIKPDKKDGKFYMMKVPFKKAKDEEEWAKSVLQTKSASSKKLYKILRHDYGRAYVRKLGKILEKRLEEWNEKPKKSKNRSR